MKTRGNEKATHVSGGTDAKKKMARRRCWDIQQSKDGKKGQEEGCDRSKHAFLP